MKPNTIFHANPSSASRVVPCGRTDGPTDMKKKLIIAFRSFAKAPNKTRLETETCVDLESFAVIILLLVLLHN